MKPCVTVSLVPEARGGPFIFWDDLPAACRKAAQFGYAAIEVFPPALEALAPRELNQLLRENHLALATIGTGGGWLRHKLTLTSASPDIRARAREFISGFIELAAPFGAAVIIGSMQGRAEGEIPREKALDLLQEALQDLAGRAANKNVTILYEHLNRYETNLLNRIEDVLPFLAGLPSNVKILADLFHMNIEEVSIADAIRAAGARLGHVHFVDSNRRPAGLGHTDFKPIFDALREIKYSGYISAEAFPYPDPDRAAEQTMRTFREMSLGEITR